MTGFHSALFAFDKLWPLCCAPIKHKRTTRLKAAAAGKFKSSWHLTGYWDGIDVQFLMHTGGRRQKCSRIRVFGLTKYILGGTCLDDIAEIHNSDPVTDMTHYR